MKYGETEIIWQRKEGSWQGSSPLLFPIVGDLHEEKITFQGEILNIKKHGFARGLEFTVAHSTQSSIVFQLKNDELQEYNYVYILSIRYTINEDKLLCEYVVENLGADRMPFCIGAHPALRTDINGESFENCYLQFSENETFEINKTNERGLIDKTLAKDYNSGRILPLKFQMFEDDACILLDINSRKILLKNEVNQAEINVEFNGFSDLGIWTMKGVNSEYICIEPWQGTPEFTCEIVDFENKHNAILLNAKEKYYAKMEISYNDSEIDNTK